MGSDWRPPEPADELWVLRECAKPGGFTPHAKGTVGLLQGLETSGLVRQSDVAPIWFITHEGRNDLRHRETR